jgi:outer membrane immunogenic protein
VRGRPRRTAGGSFKDIPVAAPPSWSGFYIGVHGGYGWGDTTTGDGGTDIKNPPYGAFACGPALTGNYCDDPFDLEPEGWFGGVQLGANWQRGVFVFGVEGDLGYLGIDDGYTLIRPFDDRDIASVEYGWYGTLTGRLGVASDRTLVYAKGGLAFADIEHEAADIDFNGTSFEIYEGSRTRWNDVATGWALGGGIEQALSRSLSLKAEYLYMDFGSETSRSPEGDIYEHDNTLHTVKIGLNYRLTDHDEPLK